MSGGSFGYFYSRGPEEISRHAVTLRMMAVECSGDELAPLRAKLDAMSARLQGVADEVTDLRDVLHAIEWFASCDTERSDLVDAWRRWVAGERPR